jgi:hypothetical protein
MKEVDVGEKHSEKALKFKVSHSSTAEKFLV